MVDRHTGKTVDELVSKKAADGTAHDMSAEHAANAVSAPARSAFESGHAGSLTAEAHESLMHKLLDNHRDKFSSGRLQLAKNQATYNTRTDGQGSETSHVNRLIKQFGDTPAARRHTRQVEAAKTSPTKSSAPPVKEQIAQTESARRQGGKKAKVGDIVVYHQPRQKRIVDGHFVDDPHTTHSLHQVTAVHPGGVIKRTRGFGDIGSNQTGRNFPDYMTPDATITIPDQKNLDQQSLRRSRSYINDTSNEDLSGLLKDIEHHRTGSTRSTRDTVNAEDAAPHNAARAEHNTLAAFMAGRAGSDTKAARAHQAAVERDAKRQTVTSEERSQRRADREAKAVTQNQAAAKDYVDSLSPAEVKERASRGPKVVNGRDYIHEAAQDKHTGNIAAERVKAAVADEPKLTKLVTDIAKEHGGKAEGLDYKVKGADSLARKIKGDQDSAAIEGKPLTSEEAAAKLFDVNRYTIVYPESSYAKSAQASIDELKKQGYTLNVKNYWNKTEHAYQGINVQATGKDGSKFELQFHTPISLDVKEGELHKVYEQQRVEKDPVVRESYNTKMHAVAARIPIPPGVQSVSG